MPAAYPPFEDAPFEAITVGKDGRIDGRDLRWTKSWQLFFSTLQQTIGPGTAPFDAEYALGAPDASLPNAIVASADGQVLRRAAGVTAFGAVDLSSANAVVNTLPQTKGGTGAASLLAADIALSARVHLTVLAGAVAGNFTVTGINVGDRLVSVLRFVGSPFTTLTDLTGEFSITAANTINNGGGTNTTGDRLLAVWIDMT